MPTPDSNDQARSSATARPNGRAGFTIAELLVVITMMGILVGLGMPPFRRALRYQTTSAAVDEFVAASGRAEAAAQRYGRAAQLHIDAASGTFYIDVDTSGTNQRATVGESHNVSTSGVTLTTTATLLCYDPRGLPSSAAGCQSGATSVTFQPALGATSEARTLQITTLGKVVR